MFLNKTSIAQPQRIVSLVPSITELLFDLGLANQIVGITKFCIKPTLLVKKVGKIGGTKNLDLPKIKLLNPDLIIANKEENNKEQIDILATTFPVFLTEVDNYEAAIKMIADIGNITSKNKEALELMTSIKASFTFLKLNNRSFKTVYLIWREPYMTIGGDTFIDDMMNKIGLKNIFRKNARYPEVTLQQIKEEAPELILLSSEPYPFKQKHIDEMRQYLPNTKILLVDGEMFSWYGSRMKYVPSYFNDLLLKVQQLTP